MDPVITHPELLNKCVRCRLHNNELITQTIRKPIGDYEVRFYNIKYSVCQFCKPKVDKAIKNEAHYYSKSFLAGMLLIMYIVGLILIFSTKLYFLIIALVFVTFGIFFLYPLFNRIYYRTRPDRLSSYFEIRKEGIIILKDFKTQSEIEKITLISPEKRIDDTILKITYQFCPNCGTQLKTNTGFCKICGKNLKIEEK